MIQGFVFDQDLIELLDFKLKTGSEVENLKGNNPKVIDTEKVPHCLLYITPLSWIDFQMKS